MTVSPLTPGNLTVLPNPSLQNAIQDNTLVRTFREALFPRILYRAEADAEEWAQNVGQSSTFTRAQNMRPTTRPIPRNRDPIPETYGIEQWEVRADQYGGSIDTDMPTAYVTIVSLFLRNMQQLGLHAAQSLNRLARDMAFNAYEAGNTNVRTTTGNSTSLPVVSLNGFTRRQLNGRPMPVGINNPLPIAIIRASDSVLANVIAATPDSPTDEIHGGVLTLDVAHGGVTARDVVLAANRSRVINAGGGVGIDSITASDQFTTADIRMAIAQLRGDLIPPHPDGTYHAHLDSTTESQIWGDEEFKRIHQSLPDHIAYREFALGTGFMGTTFYRNQEAPVDTATVDNDPNFGGTFAPETVNANGVVIHRTIFTGADWIEEKYLDESKFSTQEAGVLGKIGSFSLTAGGSQVMAERIRCIIRGPLDRLQQMFSSSWSWSGGFGFPTDAGSKTSGADYKRACVLRTGA
jgi:hypothetical protein